MSVSAYILIETQPSKNREIARKLLSIPGILSAYPVTGPYDVIAAVAIKHLENVTSIVLPSVQSIPGISKTITCIREDIG